MHIKYVNLFFLELLTDCVGLLDPEHWELKVWLLDFETVFAADLFLDFKAEDVFQCEWRRLVN